MSTLDCAYTLKQNEIFHLKSSILNTMPKHERSFSLLMLVTGLVMGLFAAYGLLHYDSIVSSPSADKALKTICFFGAIIAFFLILFSLEGKKKEFIPKWTESIFSQKDIQYLKFFSEFTDSDILVIKKIIEKYESVTLHFCKNPESFGKSSTMVSVELATGGNFYVFYSGSPGIILPPGV